MHSLQLSVAAAAEVPGAAVAESAAAATAAPLLPASASARSTADGITCTGVGSMAMSAATST